ncbi:MAG: hypothetical protein R6W77_10730 [Trueperaceae bacterium]
MTPKEVIEAFLREMRASHRDQIDAVALPEGTLEFVEDLIAAGDTETILLMLKLGYLMGLQTGFAAALAGERGPTPPPGRGPLQA